MRRLDLLRRRWLENTGTSTFRLSTSCYLVTVWWQRHAWCSYFDDITSIVLLAPLSCFDQRLEEDPRVNRLEDSLLIWKHVCNSKLLEKIQLILYVAHPLKPVILIFTGPF